MRDLIDGVYSEKSAAAARPARTALRGEVQDMDEKALAQEIRRLEKEMMDCARNLEFERAAAARDALAALKQRVLGASGKEQS